MARSAPHQISFFWEQLRCCPQSLASKKWPLHPVLGSTCLRGLPVLGMQAQNHTATVGHKSIRIRLKLREQESNHASGRHIAMHAVQHNY